MHAQAHLDARLVPPFLTEAGAAPASVLDARAALADLLSGKISPTATRAVEFGPQDGRAVASVTFEPAWDGVIVSIESNINLQPLLERYTNAFDPAHQVILESDTVQALMDLDACVRRAGASVEELREGARPVTLALAQALLDFHGSSISRVIHEEIAGMLCKPVREKTVRLLIGRFLIRQFPVPTKRTHRFTLCQALENLAEPELSEDLARLALDSQYGSLRGKLCEALARTGHSRAAETIASVLSQEPADEAKFCAIEALEKLNAVEYGEQLRAYLEYQSADKEWTRSIRKAAGKALKRLSAKA
jgi:hypothetical protein